MENEKRDKQKASMIMLFKISLNGLNTAKLLRQSQNSPIDDITSMEDKIKAVIAELEKGNPDGAMIDAMLSTLEIEAINNKPFTNFFKSKK